jgi:hypothetical protein
VIKKTKASPEWLALAALIILTAILRPWMADNPLNDDWSYLLPTLRLAKDGVLRLTGDSPATHILHVLAGGAWLKIFGGGIGGLKILILLWHALGTLFLVRLMREEGVADDINRLCALVYIFNPIILNLSITFMTDIPYLTLVIASLYAYLRAIRERRDHWIIVGTCAAGGAYLIKQLGLFLPLGLTYVLWRHALINRKRLTFAWIPLIAVFLIHQYWYHVLHGAVWRSATDSVYLRALRTLLNPSEFFSSGIPHLAGMIFHESLFLLPLLIGFGAAAKKKNLIKNLSWKHGCFAAVSFYLFWSAGTFPYIENSFYHSGIGVPTPVDTAYKSAGIFAWLGFWELLTALCFLGGLHLLTLIPELTTKLGSRPATTLLAITGGLQLLIPLLTTKYMDRYTLYGFPPLLVLLALYTGKKTFSKQAAWGAVWLSGSLFVAATIDYTAWNRAKWSLAQDAISAGIPAERIDAGFDRDLFLTFEQEMERLIEEKKFSDISEWEWLKSQPRDVFMSFASPQDIKGRSLFLEQTYKTPLSFRPAHLFLYRKK